MNFELHPYPSPSLSLTPRLLNRLSWFGASSPDLSSTSPNQVNEAMALSLLRYSWSNSDKPLSRILKERTQKERERAVAIAIKVGDGLPENLIVEILSWLPVKTLLQFKTVCKSWYAIITSPDFVSKHLKNYYRNNSDSVCLLAQYYVSQSELQLFELLIDETPRVLAHEVLYDAPMYGSYVCGPCDGLYYLYEYGSSGRALWNPVFNDLKMLPPIITKPDLPSNLVYAKSEVYGFGYDPLTDDYKVVVIKGYWSTGDDDSEVVHPSSVLVYSLRTDSWKYCGDLAQKYELESSKCYTCVNGCFYWLGSSAESENSEVIICFEFASDAFHEIQVPNYEQPASKNLGIYHDSIAFLTVHEIEKHFDIWILNDGLWTKKFTMGPHPEIRNPVGHWKKNEILLECEDGNLALCDTVTHDIRNLAFERGMMCQGVFVYLESLVSITDRNQGGHHKNA